MLYIRKTIQHTTRLTFWLNIDQNNVKLFAYPIIITLSKQPCSIQT